MPLSPPNCPTPLRRLDELSSEAAELWLKDDGQTHETYGGNKVRKVVLLVEDAMRKGARRVVTLGAAGSHHVLTTALFARSRGIGCAAILTPQPRTEHAVDTLRAALGAGLEAYPAPMAALIPLVLVKALRSGDVLVPPGGSNLLGASAYAVAFDEIVAQLASFDLEPPDWIVTAVGTGGTAAGLLAGTVAARTPTRILGVSIVGNPLAGGLVRALALGVLRQKLLFLPASALMAKLSIEAGYVGEGYGYGTPAGEVATERASTVGLELDPTYTAKAFARVLDMVDRLRETGRTRPLRIVYLHTLSSVPLAPLLGAKATPSSLPVELERLFTRTSKRG